MAAVPMKLALVAVLVMVAVAQCGTEAMITCGTVDQAVTPCLNYLRGRGSVNAQCCRGISSLNRMASTTPDRQQACKCLKQAASSMSGINPAAAEGLPGKCGVSIPYKISTSTNCANVH